MEIQTKLINHICNNYCIKDVGEITENTDLIEDLELDSMDIFRLLTDVEEIFEIQFDDVDLLTENFARIKDFAKLIEMELEKS